MAERKYNSHEEIVADIQASASGGVPFDHFKLFYESAERVTDRRISLNRTNASLAALIAAGLGIIAAWGYAQREATTLLIALAVVFFVALLAATFCRWWWKQIESYKDLNKAKFTVLREMAAKIVFVDTDKPPTCAFDPFVWEWKLAEFDRSLGRYKGDLALGSSWSELIVPKAFLAFFLAIAIAAGVLFADSAARLL